MGTLTSTHNLVLSRNMKNIKVFLSEIFQFLEVKFSITVELKWLQHLWDHGNLFEIGVVRATEG